MTRSSVPSVTQGNSSKKLFALKLLFFLHPLQRLEKKMMDKVKLMSFDEFLLCGNYMFSIILQHSNFLQTLKQLRKVKKFATDCHFQYRFDHDVHIIPYNQGHPTTVFCKISVWRSKYCLEFSKNF